MKNATLEEFDYFYRFQNTPPNIKAIFSNRRLNVGFFNQSESQVKSNRGLILSKLNLELGSLVCAKQIHSNGVCIVDKEKKGRGAQNYFDAINNTDAFITKEKDLVLAIFVADCLPIFIVDKKTNVIALVHSGWRGTKESIVKNTIFKMRQAFESQPKDICVYFGPSIRSCCYEVGEEFTDYFKSGVCRKNNKIFLDLIQINAQQVKETGVLEDNIFDSGICTFCQNDKFFSYRKERDSYARQMALIVMQ